MPKVFLFIEHFQYHLTSQALNRYEDSYFLPAHSQQRRPEGYGLAEQERSVL